MDNDKDVSEKASDDQVEHVEKSKKSRKRSKNKKSGVETVKSDDLEHEPTQLVENGALAQLPGIDKDMLKTLKALKLDEVMKMGKEAGAGSSKEYKFWNTQPVPKIDEGSGESGGAGQHKAIEPDKTIAEIKQDPYPLPEGFIWETLDLENAAVLKELYTLLNENYVEDDDAMFRFDYQPEFLRWALQVNGKLVVSFGLNYSCNNFLVSATSMAQGLARRCSCRKIRTLDLLHLRNSS